MRPRTGGGAWCAERLRVYRSARIGSKPRSVDSPVVDLAPDIVLATWSAGLAAAAGVVAWWRIVGPGYTWLAAGTVLLFGVPAAAAGGGVVAWIAVALAAGALVMARRVHVVTACLVISSVLFLVAASVDANLIAALSGALLLGGVTAEMMLGHWYLVDPRLPRSALRRLAVAGGLGAFVDVVVLAFLGVFPWESGDAVMGIGFVVLAATTALLMVAVWFALAEEGYAGVMAATGLSYLAVLTAIGAAVAGRLLVSESVLG